MPRYNNFLFILSMEQRIIHLNIADFGVAAERSADSALRSKAVIIAPSSARSAIYDMSEEAYRDGVRKGMPLRTARRLCPGAVLLPPRPELYEEAMGAVIKTARKYTPLVERSAGDGHLFLDVTGTHRLFGPAPDIGWRIRKSVRSDMGIDPIWSVAPNKLVAKVASRLVKPVGEYIVAAGEEQDFLAPLPLSLLPGLSRRELIRLREFNLLRIAHAAALSRQHLTTICGPLAPFLYLAVRGIDPSPVMASPRESGVVTFHHWFNGDTNDDDIVRSGLRRLASEAGRTLRERNQVCRRTVVQIHYGDGCQVIRQATTGKPTADDMALGRLATTALYRAWRRRAGIRRITLCCDRLLRNVVQLSLFPLENAQQRRQDALCRALDHIRHRCGADKIRRAA